MVKFALEELLDLESDWLDREGIGNEEEHVAWLEEGMDIYKRFIEIDKKEPRYSIMLADLYLQHGRDQKIRHGNHRAAYRTLTMASRYSPSKPDAFYHLSFIMATERKWEVALFYGKEALEKGLEIDKKIKLLSNLALGYKRIGYRQKAEELLNEAYELDEDLEFEWFIDLYADRMEQKSFEPILLKGQEEERKTVTRTDYKKIKDDALDGKCVVLDLTEDEKYFTGPTDTVRLEKREGEILGFLIDNRLKSCSKQRIEKAVWHDKVSPTAVKRYIFSLRKKLTQAIGADAKEILVTTNAGYEWQYNMESFVLRRN